MMAPVDDGGVEEKKEDYGDGTTTFSPRATTIVPPPPLAATEQAIGGGDVDDEQRNGFQAQWQTFAKKVFGSCGTAIEAAAYFMQQQGCRWPGQSEAGPHQQLNNHIDNNNNNNININDPNNILPGDPPPKHPHVVVDEKPPLSIADELRKLAAKEGIPFPSMSGARPADIPKFLGEEAVYSFEDDNISALSQNTLEEIAARNAAALANHNNNSNHAAGVGQYYHRRSSVQSSTGNQTPPSPARTHSLSSNSSNNNKDKDRKEV